MNKWISGLKDLAVKRKKVEKQPLSFYAAVQIALGMKAVNDKLQYIESFVAKDKIEKKKSYNSFNGSQISLNFVQDSGKAQGSGQTSTVYRKNGVQYKESLQERKQKEACHNCGKTGHWDRECRSAKKEQLNMTNFAEYHDCYWCFWMLYWP